MLAGYRLLIGMYVVCDSIDGSLVPMSAFITLKSTIACHVTLISCDHGVIHGTFMYVNLGI